MILFRIAVENHKFILVGSDTIRLFAYVLFSYVLATHLWQTRILNKDAIVLWENILQVYQGFDKNSTQIGRVFPGKFVRSLWPVCSLH